MSELFPKGRDDADAFLSRYWQKQYLYGRGAADQSLPNLEPDEIAWLATQADVESRLVFTERQDGRTTYRLEHGPFDDSRLGALPSDNWTLLVQDVDKHLPEFRQFFDLVPYIPDWRIDDLMVSVAAPGGGVGPHRDNYDVFLVQGNGQREWRIGNPAGVSDDDSAGELSLLQPFDAEEVVAATAGDIVYLPPGVPHWGIANTLCTTWSIGMRAPTNRELRAGAERVHGAEPASTDTECFYADPDLVPAESEPGMISCQAIRRVIDQDLLDPSLTEFDTAMVLGAVVTDPKAWLMPEPEPALPSSMSVHGMARVAWHAAADYNLVFVNGVGRAVGKDALAFIRECCESRTGGMQPGAIDDAEFLGWLHANGLFDSGKAGK